MHWSADYIGIPWLDRGLTREGIACWGLIRLVYAEQLGIDVPDYCSETPLKIDRAAVAGVYARATTGDLWIKIEVADIREFDVLVFRRAGLDLHAGLHVAPRRMLHVTADSESELVDYTRGEWAPRLSGVYRHYSLAKGSAA